MKRLLAALLTTVALSTPAVAAEEGHSYVGFYGLVGWADQDNVSRSGGLPIIEESSDSGGINGGAGVLFGHNWKEHGLPIRTEIAGTWRYRHDMNTLFLSGLSTFGTKSDISTTDIVASVLYDIPVEWKWKPYVGAGIGAVYADVDTYLMNPGRVDGPGYSGWDLAWQVQAGVNYALSDRWDFRVDYRYVDLGEVDTGPVASGDRFTADLVSHDVRIGAVWNF